MEQPPIESILNTSIMKFSNLKLPRYLLQGLEIANSVLKNPSSRVSIYPTVFPDKASYTSKKRFFITGVAMPESIMNTVREGRREHHEDDRASIIKGERVNNSITYGVIFGVQLSKRVAILSGLNNSITSSTIFQQEIYARPHRGGPSHIPTLNRIT